MILISNGFLKILYWALSIYEKNSQISVVAKVEFPIGKKLFHWDEPTKRVPFTAEPEIPGNFD